METPGVEGGSCFNIYAFSAFGVSGPAAGAATIAVAITAAPTNIVPPQRGK